MLAFFPVSLSGQKANTRFPEIDRAAIRISEEQPGILAKKLADLGTTELEKVRAFFSWITRNIDYNLRIYNRNKTNPGSFREDPEDTSSSLPSLDYRVAQKVLQRRTAFCDGYSRLFKTLCDLSGIESRIIHGYARVGSGRYLPFGVNHTWNTVRIDSSWYLLDVTWASGFVSYSNQFVRQLNEQYFLTPPVVFYRDHLPEDLTWTLIPEPDLYKEFTQSPFQHSGFFKFGIHSVKPGTGILRATEGDTIRFEFSTMREIRNCFISDSLYPELSNSIHLKKIQPAETYQLEFIITKHTGDWLYIFCNEEPVLRYRLQRVSRN